MGRGSPSRQRRRHRKKGRPFNEVPVRSSAPGRPSPAPPPPPGSIPAASSARACSR